MLQGVDKCCTLGVSFAFMPREANALGTDQSMREIAKRAGLDPSTISRLIAKRNKPTRRTLARLAKAARMSQDRVMKRLGW